MCFMLQILNVWGILMVNKEERSLEIEDFGIADLVSDVKRNNIIIPVFQRDFVWKPEKVAELFDSILKCYPIGSFILWATSDTADSRAISDNQRKGRKQVSRMILDGQQRITSIWYGYNGIEENDYHFSKLFVDLNASDEETVVFYDKKRSFSQMEDHIIPLSTFVKHEVVENTNQVESFSRIDELKKRFDNYKLSLVSIYGAGENIATEIFTRLNVNGKPLTTFEILCAKHYRRDEFNLRLKRDAQKDKHARCFFSFDDKTVLMALSACVTKNFDCKESTILSLDSDTFIEAWDKVDRAFDRAIDFLRSTFLIPSSKYLPYQNLVIPFVWYFYSTDKTISIEGRRILEDYFWRVSLSQSFLQGVAGQLATDIRNVMKPLVEGSVPNTEHLNRVDISYRYIEQNGKYNKNSAFCKSFLCLLATCQPKSFEDNSFIYLDGSELDPKNAKNNHHFFPKNYMKMTYPNIDMALVDHVANIVLVGGSKNKWDYKDFAPRDYLKDARDTNPELEAAFSSHLIHGDDSFGIWNDDYESFFRARIKLFQNAFLRRLIKRDSDIVDDVVDDTGDAQDDIRATSNHVVTNRVENNRVQKKYVSYLEVKFHSSFRPLSTKSNLLYVSDDNSVAFYIAVSKRYEGKSCDYYYGPRKNRMNILEELNAEKTYAVLVGLNPDCAVLIPFTFFQKLLEGCTTTPSNAENEEISHWHVNLKFQGNHAEWIVPNKENIDISEFIL